MPIRWEYSSHVNTPSIHPFDLINFSKSFLIFIGKHFELIKLSEAPESNNVFKQNLFFDHKLY